MTEIMLTLEATVDNLDVDLRPLLKELCLSTPNLANELTTEARKTAVIAPLRHLGPPYRSSSCNQSSIAARKAIVSSPPIMENKGESRDWMQWNDKDLWVPLGTGFKE